MTPEKAQVVFFVLAGLMWIIWLAGSRFAFTSLRRDGGLSGVVTGEALVPGNSEDVSRRIADRLAAHANAGGNPVRIAERTGSRIAFSRIPGLLTRRGPFFDEGEITLRQEGANVRVRYTASLERIGRGVRLATAIVCFLWGGVFAIVVPVLVWTLAVNSGNETGRWQVFQTFQMIHGAWPPWLVGSMIRSMRDLPDRYFQALLANPDRGAVEG